MRDGAKRRRWIAAGVAAALWLASGAIHSAFTWNGFLSGTIGGVMPGTTLSSVWSGRTVWTFAAALVGALTIALLHYVVGRATAAPGNRMATFVTTWFAAVAAGGLVGLASDIAIIVFSLPPARMQLLLDGLGRQAAVGGYWGLVQGWLPALLVAVPASIATFERKPADPVTTPRLLPRVLLAGSVVLSLLAVVSVGVANQRAAVIRFAEEAAAANSFDESGGAIPDPNAEGTPVAPAAPNAAVRDPSWCDDDDALLLLGAADAATGHRSQTIELLNFSDTSCIAEGYLDLAFADQNGNALDVEVIRGSSFMTTDAGRQTIEIPAGGSAIARLGWNANATDGALVATTLYAAPFRGDTRGSWPVRTDIVENSEVYVTAWELGTPPNPTE